MKRVWPGIAKVLSLLGVLAASGLLLGIAFFRDNVAGAFPVILSGPAALSLGDSLFDPSARTWVTGILSAILVSGCAARIASPAVRYLLVIAWPVVGAFTLFNAAVAGLAT
jgi:hypothetical protein